MAQLAASVSGRGTLGATKQLILPTPTHGRYRAKRRLSVVLSAMCSPDFKPSEAGSASQLALCSLVDDDSLYTAALHYARINNASAARLFFERLLSRQPHLVTCWISYAQMEKRCGDSQRFDRCRRVLQRALHLNIGSASLIQAWGLMELQRGNFLAAVMMLERCVQLDPTKTPVLKWRQVDTARKTVCSRRASRGLQTMLLPDQPSAM